MPPKYEIGNGTFTMYDGNGNIVMEGTMDNYKPKEFKLEGAKNNMEKFDLKKHWNIFINNGLVVNCKTEALANEFITYCYKNNIKWFGVDNELNYWSTYREETSYRYERYITYANKQYFEKAGYQAIEFDGFLHKKPKSKTIIIKEFIEVIYHGKETIVLIKTEGRYYKGVVKCHYQDIYDKEEGFKKAYAIAREKYKEFKGEK